jgi:hypothetical protein
MAGDAEKTMKTWAKIIESYQEIPDHFKDTFQTLPVNGGGFPYTVLTSSTTQGFFYKEKPKLVCSFDHKLYIIEESKGGVSCACFPVKDINYVEMGSILLRSWIRISGITSNGLKSSMFTFNTVTSKYFKPIIEALRTNTNNSADTDLETERNKFNYLNKLNYKFMNFARLSIMPGEEVLCTVLQPEVQVELFNILKKSLFRTISPAHITILTDSELIIIKDQRQRFTQNKYGGIWNYIPLEKITSLSLAEQTDNTFTLSIGLPENDTIRSIFAAANKPDIDKLINLAPAIV